MVEDLRKNYLLKGIEAKFVINFLDKPQNIDTTEFGIRWSYSIGSNSGFHIDPYYLVLNFDTTGKLLDTEISKH